MKVSLKIDFASHDAAKFACERWHYSKCLPTGKIVKIGAWENDKFIGVILFSRGANKSLGSPFGLGQTECCELTRIALGAHITPVSRLIRISLKFLKRISDLKLIVSFADTEQNHHGGVYQASNWIYTGITKSSDEYIYQGKRYHGRSFRKRFGSHLNYLDKGLKIVKGSQKHRYLYILDNKLNKEINKLSQKYPKRLKQASESPNSSDGATPI